MKLRATGGIAWSLGVVTVVYLAMIFGIVPFFRVFSDEVAINADFRASQLLKRGFPRDAEIVASNQVARETYDFRARLIEAEAQAAQSRYRRAADTIESALDIADSASRPTVNSRGFDGPVLYGKLWQYRWLAGQYLQASDLFAAAEDAGADLTPAQIEKVIESGSTVGEALFAGNRIRSLLYKQPLPPLPDVTSVTADLKIARVSGGVRIVNGHLLFDRESTATLVVPDGVSTSTGCLVLEMKANRVLGMLAQIEVSIDGFPVGRFYPCWPAPELAILNIPSVKPGQVLGLKLLHGESDPVSGEARKAEILMLAFAQSPFPNRALLKP